MEGTRRPPAKNKTGEICWDTSSFRSSKFYSTRTTLKQVTPVWNTGVTLSDCRAEAARIFEQQRERPFLFGAVFGSTRV